MAARTSPTSSRAVLLTLAAVTGLAAALRIPGLDSGLWFDEVVTLVESARLPLRDLLTTYGGENNHPLYSLLASLSLRGLGESPWTLRLPAFLFGVACVPALYAFARRFTGSREALLTAALLTVSYHHVWFSQNARGYTMLLFFTLVGSARLFDLLDSGGRGAAAGFAVCMALALYTHLTAAFVLAGQAGAVLVYGRDRRALTASVRKAVPAFLFVAAGALLLYAPILPQVFAAFDRRLQAAGAPEMQDFATVKVDTWTEPLWALRSVLERIGPWQVAAAIVLVVVLLGGLLSFRRQRFLLALTVVPGVLGAAVLLLLQRHFYPRFFFFAAGFALLMLVRGLAVVARRVAPGRSVQVATGLTCLALAASATMLPRNYRWPKQDFAGARDYVESQRGPDSVVVSAGLARVPFAELYAPSWGRVETVADLESVPAAERWLVFYDRTYMQSVHPELLAHLDAHFRVDREFPGTVGGGTLFVCRSP